MRLTGGLESNFRLLKPCHMFVCLRQCEYTKALHSAVESVHAQRIVQRDCTYHQRKSQKSAAGVGLQRQQRANSRTEMAPESSTFTLPISPITIYCGR